MRTQNLRNVSDVVAEQYKGTQQVKPGHNHVISTGHVMLYITNRDVLENATNRVAVRNSALIPGVSELKK